ncbi:unnamed protein product [Lactuca virosa]|uniref:Uncharacterized protein n=1 Tax=Lactuca virosa TaxID=75947 RepID=A0AAU9ME17_9ASTR|nr:unnamed protein product [Lactuca virosa]
MAELRVAVMGGMLWQLRCLSIAFYRRELGESGARKMAGGDEGFSVVLEVWVVLGREEVRGSESGGGVVYARVGTTEMKKRRFGLWLVNNHITPRHHRNHFHRLTPPPPLSSTTTTSGKKKLIETYKKTIDAQIKS